jgi:hypothetical protein
MSFGHRGWGMMSIYGEMSMYGDIFIIDTQILIHAQLFPPPVFTLCGNEVVAPLRRKLTIEGNHEVKLVSKGLVSNLPAPLSIAPENLSGS